MNINSLLRNSITKNFFSLSSIQFFNVILPFITIPYLTRTLGLEYFGIVSYAQVFITYFISLADYGFITTATRDIALHKNNIAKVSSIFSSVLTMKLLFAMLGFILFVIMIFSFERLNKHWEVYLLSYVFVIGQTMLPIWFFQGIEKMKYLSLLNLCGKIIFTILIFFVVKLPANYIYVNLCNGIGAILISVFSLWIIITKFKVIYIIPSKKDLYEQLKEGWHVFLANFAINGYINSAMLILGFFASPLLLGYYSIADKIIFSSRALLVVISQSIFPHVCRLSLEKPEQLKLFLRKALVMIIITILMVSSIFFIFPSYLLQLVAGQTNEEIISIMRILSFAPLIVSINIPCCLILLCYNLKSSFSGVIVIGAVFSIIINVILCSIFGVKGAATAVLLTEAFISIGLYIVIEIKHRKFSLFNNL